MDSIEEKSNSIRDYLERANRTYDKLENIYENVGGILDFANNTFNSIEKGAELFDEEKLEKAYDHMQMVEFLDYTLSKSRKKFCIVWFMLVIGTVASYFLL